MNSRSMHEYLTTSCAIALQAWPVHKHVCGML